MTDVEFKQRFDELYLVFSTTAENFDYEYSHGWALDEIVHKLHLITARMDRHLQNRRKEHGSTEGSPRSYK